jgi:hypothetical protein
MPLRCVIIDGETHYEPQKVNEMLMQHIKAGDSQGASEEGIFLNA